MSPEELKSHEEVLRERNALAKRVEELVEQTNILAAQNRRVQNNFTTAVERGEELENWILWCHKTDYPLTALCDEAAKIATRRAGREKT